ncbi:MAG: ATP-dependent DNA helicase RecG [Planctomycetaceae bacterium]
MEPTIDTNPLQTEIRFAKGVGPARAELLEKLGIRTVEEMLWTLPRDVLDLSDMRTAQTLEEDVIQSVRGQVVDIDGRKLSRGRTLSAVLLECEGGHVRGNWFNQPWVLKRFQPGETVMFSGKPKRRSGRWEFSHPRVQWLGDDDEATNAGVLPRYSLTEGLSMDAMRRMMRSVVENYVEFVPELLPEDFRTDLNLPDIRTALRSLHIPETIDQYRAGLRRVLFDDLFEFQLGLAMKRRAWKTEDNAATLPVTVKIDSRIRRLFPFTFTEGQNAAVGEIVADLQSGFAMHRLLQADVGAGKTAVALYAMLVAVAAGYQTALMAPTEVLALQHWDTIENALSHSRVERRLLTGDLTAAQRTRMLDGIRSGDVQLVVGTQAIIQKDVQFQKLGLVVIDEQHKFGVMQRAHFSLGNSGKNISPHVLVMTATPIPRSLCLTQFGDLDISTISDLPPGRQRIVTSRIRGEKGREKVWDFVREQLRKGRQAYVVCPRVDAGDADPTASQPMDAERAFQELQSGELKNFRVGLVHGRMERDRKAAAMRAFREGETQVLVSTTVIEVGVDVPNATIMVIMGAERFGLSQLHQLRGRIGRGKFQGYCFLFSDTESDIAAQRLFAMESTSDGFRIAETDFELRGPGDILGTRQHGQLPLRVANLQRDQQELLEARKEAFTLMESGSFDQPEFAPLKIRVLERFGQLLELPQTG